MGDNRLQLAGSLQELSAPRWTPAGVPVIEFSLAHSSEQPEGGGIRKVECEVPAVAVGDLAKVMAGARVGQGVKATGFMAPRSRNRKSLVLHVTEIEFLEGIDHGLQAEER